MELFNISLHLKDERVRQERERWRDKRRTRTESVCERGYRRTLLLYLLTETLVKKKNKKKTEN